MPTKILSKPTRSHITAVATLGLAPLIASSATAQLQQPKIGSRQIPAITVDGLKFRDLNRNGQLDPYEDWRLSPEVRAADLVSRMSLAEKAGTMMHSGNLKLKGDVWDAGDYDFDRARSIILQRHITTGLTRLQRVEPAEFARQHNVLQEIAEEGRLGVPFTVSIDPRTQLSRGEGDSALLGFSKWPEPIGFGAIGDPEIVRNFADIARREYRSVGIHMTLSPMAELATEPRWIRIFGTFGEDPKRVRDLVRAYVEGFQGGSDGLTRDGVISIVKHWAGYGAAAEKGIDAHSSLGRWSGFPGGAFEQHLIPYEGAFAVKVAGVMPTYTILRDLVHEGHAMEPVGGGFNKYLLQNLLRQRYGFEGMILSDFGITADFPWGMEDATPLERYVKALDAGIDQFGGREDLEYLIEAVESGLVKEEQLDDSAQRILVDKFRIGLFENPYVSPEQASAVASTPEYHAAGVKAQKHALVLLKNENAILPLRGNTDSAPPTYFLRGIDTATAEAKGLKVVTDPSQADLAIVRLRTPQEGGSIGGNLAFMPGQPEFDAVVSLAASGLPVIACVHLNRPAVMTALLPHVQGLFSDFGITDDVLLDVIFGQGEPEGRLPFELPSSMAAVEAQKPDLPHDSENPLFPIRFGLRYGK